MISQAEVDKAFGALALDMEELETLDAPWNWGDFFGGVGLGFAGVGLVAAGMALT
ncbi:MAG: daptide-type RiPP [Motilibacteraceae bacterium]